jgi:hypothetical protein
MNGLGPIRHGASGEATVTATTTTLVTAGANTGGIIVTSCIVNGGRGDIQSGTGVSQLWTGRDGSSLPAPLLIRPGEALGVFADTGVSVLITYEKLY